jgi:hypothetical protein
MQVEFPIQAPANAVAHKLTQVTSVVRFYQLMDTETQTPDPPKTSRPSWKRWTVRLVILYVFVPYVTVSLIFAVMQRHLLYRPTVADSLHLADVNLDADFGGDVELKTTDGNTLRGWLLKGKDRSEESGEAWLVVYFPGNSLNRFERLADLREVAAVGFDVLIFDYRGFGDSTGSPNESDLSADALLVWNYAVHELGYKEGQIVIFGESLGGAVALSLWSETNPHPPKPAALILNSTFASLPQTVAWHYPVFPFRFLLLDRWPSIDHIGNVPSPIIVFHGTEDEMVPVAHGRALANGSNRARFIEIPGASHNDVPTGQLRGELNSTKVRGEAR